MLYILFILHIIFVELYNKIIKITFEKNNNKKNQNGKEVILSSEHYCDHDQTN